MNDKAQAEETETLHPDQYIRVGGEDLRVVKVPATRKTIHVRELDFGQSLRMEPVAAPIIESLGEAVENGRDSLDWEKIMAAIGQHPEAFTDLLSESTGETREAIEKLSDRDGRLVVVAFMKVNWDFFIDRLVVRKGTRYSTGQKASPEGSDSRA